MIKLQHHIEELYYGIMSWPYITKDITELYYRTILRIYIMGSHYRIRSWNYITERPNEKEPENRRHVPEAPGIHWTPGHALGPPTDGPGNPQGPPGTPMHHKNGHSSTSLQRQKLSIASVASESVGCNASPQRSPWTVFLCLR